MANPNESFRRTPYLALVSTLSACFFAYAVLRAVRVSLTIDEAQTWLRYLSASPLAVFDFGVANNHFLNTLLAWIFSSIFGSGELVLRIPNLLGYALYLVFGFRLLDRRLPRATAVFGFLLLNLNPYILDFFSLCRGYGLSLGFLATSLYFFERFLSATRDGRPDSSRALACSLGAAGAGVLSNFALLDVYLGLFVLAAAALILFPRQGEQAPGENPPSRPAPSRGRNTAIALIAAVVAFNGLVILNSHDAEGRTPSFSSAGLRILILALIAAAAIALAAGLGRLLIRRKLLKAAQWKALSGPTLSLAGFITYPLFILKKGGELYWGGPRGLVRDTWTSLADGSFYGKLYFERQNLAVASIVFVLVALFVLALFFHKRNRSLVRALPAASVLGIILLVSAAIAAQHAVLRTPYPIGRTALFFVPLFAFFAVFSLQALGDSGRRAARPAALVLLAVLTALSGAHFLGTANTVMAAEWRIDADTKQLVKDLPEIKARIAPDAPVLRLGVEWNFSPSLAYYLRSGRLPWLDAKSTDLRDANDLYFLHETYVPDRMILIKDYPISGNILVRPKAEIR